MRILLPPYNGCCCLHAKTGLWVSVNPWGQNNTQFGLARWNAHRLWHLCLWMWTSPLQYWRQFKVNVLTPWLWIVSIHVIPFILNMCYIWSWPWSYTLLLTFNTVDSVVYVTLLVNLYLWTCLCLCTCLCYYRCLCESCLWKKRISLWWQPAVKSAWEVLMPWHLQVPGHQKPPCWILLGVRHRKFFFYL